MSLSEFRDKMAMDLFGMTKAEAHAKGVCIDCKKIIVDSMLTERDKAEYRISGLCPDCFEKSVSFAE